MPGVLTGSPHPSAILPAQRSPWDVIKKEQNGMNLLMAPHCPEGNHWVTLGCLL